MSEFVWELPPVRPTPAVSVESTANVIDHSQAAVDRLVQQFKKPKIILFLQSFLTPLAALEQAAIDMLANRSVDTAVGAQLEIVARLVGQPLLNLDDDTLRRYIRARIRVKRSSGTGPQLLEIVRLVLDDALAVLRLNNCGNATLVITIEDVVLDDDLPYAIVSDFLVPAVAAGVRVVLEWWPVVTTELFQFATYTPGSETGQGWGSTLDATVGGALASAADE